MFSVQSGLMCTEDCRFFLFEIMEPEHAWAAEMLARRFPNLPCSLRSGLLACDMHDDLRKLLV